MRSQRSKNSRARERAIQIERAFFYDLIWLAFLVAVAIIFLPLASHGDDYQADAQNLAKLDTQIEKQKTDLEDLRRQENSESDLDLKNQIQNKMVLAYKQLEKLSTDRQTLSTHIQFKHPEKDFDGKYESHHTARPLESFERDTTLDGKLDTFLNKLHAVYGLPVKEKKHASSFVNHRVPASIQEKKPVNPDDVDQPITLSK